MALDLGVLLSKREQIFHRDREGILAKEETEESVEPIVLAFLGPHRLEDSPYIRVAGLVDLPFEEGSYISIFNQFHFQFAM